MENEKREIVPIRRLLEEAHKRAEEKVDVTKTWLCPNKDRVLNLVRGRINASYGGVEFLDPHARESLLNEITEIYAKHMTRGLNKEELVRAYRNLLERELGIPAFKKRVIRGRREQALAIEPESKSVAEELIKRAEISLEKALKEAETLSGRVDTRLSSGGLSREEIKRIKRAIEAYAQKIESELAQDLVRVLKRYQEEGKIRIPI